MEELKKYNEVISGGFSDSSGMSFSARTGDAVSEPERGEYAGVAWGADACVLRAPLRRQGLDREQPLRPGHALPSSSKDASGLPGWSAHDLAGHGALCLRQPVRPGGHQVVHRAHGELLEGRHAAH